MERKNKHHPCVAMGDAWASANTHTSGEMDRWENENKGLKAQIENLKKTRPWGGKGGGKCTHGGVCLPLYSLYRGLFNT